MVTVTTLGESGRVILNQNIVKQKKVEPEAEVIGRRGLNLRIRARRSSGGITFLTLSPADVVITEISLQSRRQLESGLAQEARNRIESRTQTQLQGGFTPLAVGEFSSEQGEGFAIGQTGQEFITVASARGGGTLAVSRSQLLQSQQRRQEQLRQQQIEDVATRRLRENPASIPAQFFSPEDPFGFTSLSTLVGGAVSGRSPQQTQQALSGVTERFARRTVQQTRASGARQAARQRTQEFFIPAVIGGAAVASGGIGIFSRTAQAGIVGLTVGQGVQTIRNPNPTNIGSTLLGLGAISTFPGRSRPPTPRFRPEAVDVQFSQVRRSRPTVQESQSTAIIPRPTSALVPVRPTPLTRFDPRFGLQQRVIGLSPFERQILREQLLFFRQQRGESSSIGSTRTPLSSRTFTFSDIVQRPRSSRTNVVTGSSGTQQILRTREQVVSKQLQQQARQQTRSLTRARVRQTSRQQARQQTRSTNVLTAQRQQQLSRLFFSQATGLQSFIGGQSRQSQRTRTTQGLRQQTRQTQIQIPALNIDIGSIQVSDQSQRERLFSLSQLNFLGRLSSQLSSLSTVFARSSNFPSFDFGSQSRRRRSRRKRRVAPQEIFFQPSFTAGFFNITGIQTQTLTGLELRPVPRKRRKKRRKKRR